MPKGKSWLLWFWRCRDKKIYLQLHLYSSQVLWCSRLQQIVALSTTEAEYISATEASKEAIWLTRLRSELGLPKQIPALHCDNQSAICLAKNPVCNARTKHINIRYHFIREVIEDDQIQLIRIDTTENPADCLTKCLSKTLHQNCLEQVGIIWWSNQAPLSGGLLRSKALRLLLLS